MGRNIDRGLEGREERQRGNDSNRKSGSSKVIEDTKKSCLRILVNKHLTFFKKTEGVSKLRHTLICCLMLIFIGH